MHYAQRKAGFYILSAAALLLWSETVWAKPQITVSLAATKEVVEIKNGLKNVTTGPATSAVSGDIVTYTITCANTGNEAAANAVVNNPIPAGMSYIDTSAFGKDTDILFSIDCGKTYKKPSLLTYEISLPGGVREKHTARPEEYTHIRWVLKSLASGATATVGFRVRIK